MAGHLKAKGGHEVTVYNRTAAKTEKWVSQYGGKTQLKQRQAANKVELRHEPASATILICARSCSARTVCSPA